MSSSPAATDSNDCRLLHLPLELRQRIYRNVISPKYTKTPKDAETGVRSSTRYDWNIDPSILRVNRQISAEASAVIGRENDFVVIERSQDLEQGKNDLIEDDPTVMIYNVILWPGKGVKIATVPGERMRLRLGRNPGIAGKPAIELKLHILLLDELRDFCIALSIFEGPDGRYRTSGLSAHIRLVEPDHAENPQAQDDMRTSLLKPLTRLRHLEDVEVEGMAPFVAQTVLGDLKRTDFDGAMVISTVKELIFSGDCARDEGLHSMATAYYQRASEYFHHFAREERSAFTESPGSPVALEFEIMQHRALNWIEEGNFEDAFQVSNIALEAANMIFTATAPTTTSPRRDAQGVVTKGAFRQWTCQCIKEGAERIVQLIKAEDVGRCYYYRSISGHVVGGHEVEEHADDDKMTGIGCCLVSDTVGDCDVPKELLELDIRAMEKLGVHKENGEENSEDEWEDDVVDEGDD